MRTENLAIVFVDIAGFTPRTSAQTREENLQLLRRFDGVVRPLARAYNGRVVKTMGDAFLLTFRSPTDALLCSMGIHDRLVELDAKISPADRFTVRAAVNVGEVRIESNDIFGEAVNIASRIEGLAGAGEIYFSESAFLSMTRTEVPNEEIGYTELKGIPEKIRLYRVPRSADNAALPFAGRGLDRVRNKLGSLSASQILTPVAEHAQGLLSKTPAFLAQAAESASHGVVWWRVEVRRSRAVQYGTAAAVVLLVILLIWTLNHRPATPFQKLHRALGF